MFISFEREKVKEYISNGKGVHMSISFEREIVNEHISM